MITVFDQALFGDSLLSMHHSQMPKINIIQLKQISLTLQLMDRPSGVSMVTPTSRPAPHIPKKERKCTNYKSVGISIRTVLLILDSSMPSGENLKPGPPADTMIP